MTPWAAVRFSVCWGAATLAALAGCSAGTTPESSTPQTPVDLGGGKQDDQGGMIIGDHFGPNGQLFYGDHEPVGHSNPVWFHTLAHGPFPYHFEHERLGWALEAASVTDYSRIDYDLVEHGDRTFISTHVAPHTFGDAFGVTYVTGSVVHGGMGPDLIPFGDREDAAALRAEHHGTLVAFEDVSQERLLQLSRDH